jgi:hypothetical protein
MRCISLGANALVCVVLLALFAACTRSSSNRSDGAADASSPAVLDGSSHPLDANEDGAVLCALVAQTGCAAGERCGLRADRSIACIPIGTKERYEDCDPNAVVDECGAGYACLRSVDMPSVPYQCTAFCTDETAQSTCGWDSCVDRSDLPAKICSTYTQCRPTAQDCPPRSDGIDDCYIIEDDRAACLASADNPVPVGGACALPIDCEVGSSCIRVARGNPARVCMKHCDLAKADPGCPAQTVCTALGPFAVCR